MIDTHGIKFWREKLLLSFRTPCRHTNARLGTSDNNKMETPARHFDVELVKSVGYECSRTLSWIEPINNQLKGAGESSE